MPLIETTVNSLKADIANAPSEDIFLVLSSAKDETGETWCIYCSLIEDEVDQVFGKEENYALTIKFARPEFRAADNWVRDEYKSLGVPMIFRLKKGERVGTPLGWAKKDFLQRLEAFVKSPEAFEEYLKVAEGDNYKDATERWSLHMEGFEEMQEVLRGMAAEEAAAKTAEAAATQQEKAACEGEACVAVTA